MNASRVIEIEGHSASSAPIVVKQNIPIAIVGMGCRLPGNCHDAESYWKLLAEGRSGICEVPEDRWNRDRFYHPDPATSGTMISKWGGFVSNPDQFDARFWGLSPREAMRMDPQQRWLLEVAWEAIEDSGTAPQNLRGSDVGVFVGISATDFGNLQLPYHHNLDAYTISGSTASIAANRVSYMLDLRGPSASLDTACSSSLVAVWSACQNIWSGNCSAALAGGVNVIIAPYATIGFSRAAMLSKNGQCHAFDSRANGYVRSEGAGLVYLKPLVQAQADGDRIYAVIRGAAVNQDGHTSSMTVPGVEGQSAMLRRAYQNAGIDPSQVAYVEAHGTGTPVGDPIEVAALARVIGARRTADNPCLIGSAKSNIGHLETGSGIAGLIKAALVLHHRQIPANRNFEKPNPSIPFEQYHLAVSNRLQPLNSPAGKLPVVGVNSFGFGGTNAHVVLEAAPSIGRPVLPAAVREQRPFLLPISARDETALHQYVTAFSQLLDRADVNLADVCYTAGVRKEQHERRLVAIGWNAAELKRRMNVWLSGSSQVAGITTGRAKIAPAPLTFVFTGQGAQWWAMGRQLLNRETVFLSKVQEIDALFQPLAGWSLLAAMQATEAESKINRTDVAQPAIFALQVGLTELWKSWGIQPAQVIGHSVGEVAAAYVAGIYSLADATKVIFHRSRLQNTTGGHGRMLAVGISANEAREVIGPDRDRVALAVINSPGMITLSGDTQPLEAIAVRLQSSGRFLRWLPIDYAFHTHQMDPIRDDLIAALKDIVPRESSIPFVSTVTGDELDGRKLDGDYWWRNVREPVQFEPAIARIIKSQKENFLEIGPHPALRSSLQESLDQANRTGLIFHSLHRQHDDSLEMGQNLAALHVHGFEVNWLAVSQSQGSFVPLPSYPWNRETCWSEVSESRHRRLEPFAHPLLGIRTTDAQPTWETKLDLHRLNYLEDHQLWNSVVFPGAGFGEMGLALAKILFPHEPHAVEDLEIKKALFVRKSELPTLQIVFSEPEKSFSVFSRLDDRAGWELNAQGRLARMTTLSPQPADLVKLRQPLTEFSNHEQNCQKFAAAGYQFGPNFQLVHSLWRVRGEAIGEIQTTSAVHLSTNEYVLHPSILDACFHVALGVRDWRPKMEDNFLLPTSVRRIQVYHQSVSRRMWVHAKTSLDDGRVLIVDLVLYDESGRRIADVLGFRSDWVAQRIHDRELDNCYYQARWQPRQQRGTRIHGSCHFPATAKLALTGVQAARQIYVDRQLDQFHLQYQPRVDAVIVSMIQNAFLSLGWQPQMGAQVTASEFFESLKIIPQHQRLVRSQLNLLARQGVLETMETDRWKVLKTPVECPLEQELLNLRQEFPRFLADTELLQRNGQNIAAVICGDVDPVELMFPAGSAENVEAFYVSGADFPAYNELMRTVIAQAVEQLPSDRVIRVLEVGAGTGSLTRQILAILPADRTEYCFTDIGPSFVAAARKQFASFAGIDFKSFDLEKDLIAQGLEPGTFDLVIATNVLHATVNLKETLLRVKSCLAPDGLLAFLEAVALRPIYENIVFGVLPGWWRFEDFDLRLDSPLLNVEQWQSLLLECGFVEPACLSCTPPGVESDQAILLARPGTPHVVTEQHSLPKSTGVYLLLRDQGGVINAIDIRLREQGHRTILIERGSQYQSLDPNHFLVSASSVSDFQRVLVDAELEVAAITGVVHGWSLDLPKAQGLSTEDLTSAQQFSVMSAFTMAQAWNSASHTWFLTRDIYRVLETDQVQGLAASPLSGFVRVANNEQAPRLSHLIDLGDMDAEVVAEQLLAEINAKDNEVEVAFREGRRFVTRLHRVGTAELPLAEINAVQSDGTIAPFRLESDQPGVLNKLVLRQTQRRELGANEIEVRVRAGGINFRDVMKALATYPGNPVDLLWFGDDFSGTIERVGVGVTNLRPGDEVAGMAPYAFQAYAVVDAGMVFQKPPQMSFDEAATLPTVFLTAHYAMIHLARMKRGESILIHGGTGGVGLAAIQIAQRLGLEIFATAGTPEKRQLLTDMGVPHVLNSRTLEFSDEVMRITLGRGVDAVLNSLAGEFIPKSLDVLAPFGRFLEIGKVDIYRNTKIGLHRLRDNISYFVIDLGQHLTHNLQAVIDLFGELREQFFAGAYQALPHTVFPITQAAEAFRYMAQGKHIGKNVLSFDEQNIPIARSSDPQRHFSGQTTWLVTGGAGGFCWEIVKSLIEHGVRHVALFSRSGPQAESTIQEIENLRGEGIEIVDIRGDVTRREDVERAINQIAQSMPSLKGVLHGAMVLDDEFLTELDAIRFQKVLDTKMLGAWNLHVATLDQSLDQFISFSSFSHVVGGPRQASYNAGNAFLEGLAEYRRSRGLAAMTIAWGSILGAGFVERNRKTAEYLDKVGMKSFELAEALEIFHQILSTNISQLAASRADWRQLLGRSTGPMFSELEFDRGSADQGLPLASRLSAASIEERIGIVESLIAVQIAGVFGLDPEKIDRETSLSQLGLDSLMAIELKNRIEQMASISLPMTEIMHGPSLSQLALVVLKQLGEPEAAAESAGIDTIQPALSANDEHQPASQLLDKLDQLSESEIDALLADVEATENETHAS